MYEPESVLATAFSSLVSNVPPETVTCGETSPADSVPPENSSVADAFSRQNGPAPAAFRDRRSKRTVTPAAATYTDTLRSELVPERAYLAAPLSSVSLSSVPL